ncbi:MAG TPA: SDR family NAD(P)-dependent oxidoreductase, partial [Vicinamibacterales bacterium]|nr:SDR family NAD(P)-dependent oxidoreductase [Vicinamibacterales bacterium]
MDLKLSGGVAIVTGASRGIGRAIAETLAAEGMNITVAARSKDQLDDLAKSMSTECLVQAVDLRKAEAAAAVVDATVKRFGRIDLL